MDVVDVTRHRGEFFRVLHTTRQTQTAVMTIAPGGDAGPPEVHDGDQVIYVIAGEAAVTVGSEQATVGPGTVLTIPAGTPHDVRNGGKGSLFFLTVYAPPEY
jgi:mannose-6-phosphate isomerase-like protein (cupin superfamily)